VAALVDAGPALALSPDFDPMADTATAATTVFVVENMHCGHCMRAVETAVGAMPGVVHARVNLSSKRLSVVTHEPPTSLQPFIDVLADKGFAASPLVEASQPRGGAVDARYLSRLGVAGFAAANIMLLSVAVWSGHAGDMPASQQTLFHWLSALIALPAVAFAGQPFFASARQALKAGRLNMDVPISLGVVLATGMSLFQTVRGSEQVYFDAAVTLLFFLLVGRALDQAVRAKAASAAENLLGRRAVSASRITDAGAVEAIDVSAIRPGMRLQIAAGEQLPVDGRISRGNGTVDESIISGESRPRLVGVADVLHAGSVAIEGPFEVVVIAAAENSTLAEIARLMQTAEQARGHFVRLADRAARLYAPMVHLLGAVTFFGWLLSGAGWEAALTAAIAVLIITCPCALALAVPAVQVVATSRLFRNGVVLKSPDALERFAEIDTVVFDKTGTLTLGRPELKADAGIADGDIAVAAGLAVQSRHPYAQAIVRAQRRRGVPAIDVAEVKEFAGQGLEGRYGGEVVRLGSAAFCNIAAHASAGGPDSASLWLKRGDANPIALAMTDAVRDDAGAVVQALRRDRIGVEILSGDTADAVGGVAQRLGVAQWRAGQRPDDKIARLDMLLRDGRKVLMVGDGLNDAPALAAGHASLSPSTATDISQMAADAVFQGDRLNPVLTVLAVAKGAKWRALENFAIAIGYNLLFVPLAMLGLVTPLIAAIAMSTSSIAVTLNALRLGGGRKEIVS
jgi:Cu2+-exporting ATPase